MVSSPPSTLIELELAAIAAVLLIVMLGSATVTVNDTHGVSVPSLSLSRAERRSVPGTIDERNVEVLNAGSPTFRSISWPAVWATLLTTKWPPAPPSESHSCSWRGVFSPRLVPESNAPVTLNDAPGAAAAMLYMVNTGGTSMVNDCH